MTPPTPAQVERAKEALAPFAPFVATHAFMQGAWLEALGHVACALATVEQETWEAAAKMIEEVATDHRSQQLAYNAKYGTQYNVCGTDRYFCEDFGCGSFIELAQTVRARAAARKE